MDRSAELGTGTAVGGGGSGSASTIEGDNPAFRSAAGESQFKVLQSLCIANEALGARTGDFCRSSWTIGHGYHHLIEACSDSKLVLFLG